MTSSIAVIGAGIVGLSCALHLAEAGYFVTLYEGDKANDNASKAAMGVVSVKGVAFAHSQRYKNILSEFWRLKAEASVASCQTGVYEFFATSADLNTVLKRIAYRRFRGLYNIELLKKEALPNLVHGSVLKEAGALYYPEDFFFKPWELLDAKMAKIEKNGCQKVAENVDFIGQTQSSQLLVKTRSGQREFDDVLICAGAGSLDLLSRFCESPPQFKLQKAQSGRILHVNTKASFALKKGKESFQLNHGDICFGPLKEDFNEKLLCSYFQQKWGLSLDLAGSQFLQRSATRVVSSKRVPFIGTLQLKNSQKRVLVATAFDKNGYLLGDLAARRILTILMQTQSYLSTR